MDNSKKQKNHFLKTTTNTLRNSITNRNINGQLIPSSVSILTSTINQTETKTQTKPSQSSHSSQVNNSKIHFVNKAGIDLSNSDLQSNESTSNLNFNQSNMNISTSKRTSISISVNQSLNLYSQPKVIKKHVNSFHITKKDNINSYKSSKKEDFPLFKEETLEVKDNIVNSNNKRQRSSNNPRQNHVKSQIKQGNSSYNTLSQVSSNSNSYKHSLIKNSNDTLFSPRKEKELRSEYAKSVIITNQSSSRQVKHRIKDNIESLSSRVDEIHKQNEDFMLMLMTQISDLVKNLIKNSEYIPYKNRIFDKKVKERYSLDQSLYLNSICYDIDGILNNTSLLKQNSYQYDHSINDDLLSEITFESNKRMLTYNNLFLSCRSSFLETINFLKNENEVSIKDTSTSHGKEDTTLINNLNQEKSEIYQKQKRKKKKEDLSSPNRRMERKENNKNKEETNISFQIDDDCSVNNESIIVNKIFSKDTKLKNDLFIWSFFKEAAEIKCFLTKNRNSYDDQSLLIKDENEINENRIDSNNNISNFNNSNGFKNSSIRAYKRSKSLLNVQGFIRKSKENLVKTSRKNQILIRKRVSDVNLIDDDILSDEEEEEKCDVDEEQVASSSKKMIFHKKPNFNYVLTGTKENSKSFIEVNSLKKREDGGCFVY